MEQLVKMEKFHQSLQQICVKNENVLQGLQVGYSYCRFSYCIFIFLCTLGPPGETGPKGLPGDKGEDGTEGKGGEKGTFCFS